MIEAASVLLLLRCLSQVRISRLRCWRACDGTDSRGDHVLTAWVVAAAADEGHVLLLEELVGFLLVLLEFFEVALAELAEGLILVVFSDTLSQVDELVHAHAQDSVDHLGGVGTSGSLGVHTQRPILVLLYKAFALALLLVEAWEVVQTLSERLVPREVGLQLGEALVGLDVQQLFLSPGA